MTDNLESFDNICINPNDYIVEIEGMNNQKRLQQHIFNDTSGEISVDHFLNENGGKSKVKLILEDSSDEDDEATLIRQISVPLLNKSRGKRRLNVHQYVRHNKKISKLIGICFIFSLVIALVVVCFLIFLPSNFIYAIRNLFMKSFTKEVIGCDQMSVEDVWIRSYPRLISEGAIRLVKIDPDDVFDFVIPFGTNVVQSKISHLVCSIYYPGQKRCFGGLLALNGINGDILWRYDASGEMYALTCSEDLNKDGWIDCIGAGRFGTLAAVSGRDGSELWAFDKNPERNGVMNLYTPQFIDDIDGDGVKDVVEMHGGDPVAKPNEMNRLVAKLIVFSGRTGRILVSKSVPDSHESYYSPQLLNAGDGVINILYGTGGETFPGNLFVSSMQQFLHSRRDQQLTAKKVYQGPKKGVMTPPVLVDLNSDGRDDIVICPFGDVCMAFDGATLKQIWLFDLINSSETYASPAAGYYNEDDVPDIFIQMFVGLGYPVYFYGETIILDGRTGKIIKRLSRSNNVVTTSPLTLSVEGSGNDIFLFWLQLCRGHENDVDRTPFQNIPQYLLSRAHVCKIRFNTTTESLYLAHGRNLLSPSNEGVQIYNSENYINTQSDINMNTTWLIEQFLTLHPKMRKMYKVYQHSMSKEQHDLSDDSEDYYSQDINRKTYHNELVKDQEEKEGIDLNDATVHSSIDFEEPLPGADKKDDKRYFNEEPQDEDIRPLVRTKRHNGPHDGEGQQRLIATGTLCPSILKSDDKDANQTIDVAFSTYWSTPREVVLQTRKEMNCNKDWMDKENQRFTSDSKFFHYDHDHYSEYGNRYCAKKYGNTAPPTNLEKGSTIFNIHAGQLTVFRKRLKCTCSPSRLKWNQRCSRILPLHLQTWPAYLGLAGTAHWNASYHHLYKG